MAGSVVALGCSLTLQAALPTPLVSLRFSEGSGTSTANEGSLGGTADFAQADALPDFTTSVPTGTFAPASNVSAVDFGPVAAGQGGRAIDLIPSAGDSTLGALEAFTVCGWVNARELNEGFGGNRIAFALASPAGPGFDLVQLGNGALRLGVNDWPDGGSNGPASTAGAIIADPNAGSANWIFFALTYDSTLAAGQVKYFFGSGAVLARLSSAHTYARGPIESSGTLTVGNFGTVVGARTETGDGGSRIFRGLVDELRVYDAALELAQVQEAQINGTPPPQPVTIGTPPANRSVYVGADAVFTVAHTGTAPFTYQWQRDGTDILSATGPTYTLSAAALTDSGAQFRVKVSNAASTDITSGAGTLTVVADTGPRVSLSFSESSVAVSNKGTLAGSGAYVATNGFPAISNNVPAGPEAPSNNFSSVDFGTIAGGQGSRAIDLSNAFDNTLGSMAGFTVTGWLNCADLDEGYGGNRIAFALASPAGPGLDLVQTESGGLRIGINDWPDGGSNGPSSSPGLITADPTADAANWIFFAVTYDSTLAGDQVSYYFGSPTSVAALDSTATYDRGPISTSGPLTVGNFSSVVGARNENGPNGPSRCFRGLIDELNIHSRALAIEEIRAQQTAAAYQPANAAPVSVLKPPQNTSVFDGGDAVFQVSIDGTPPYSYQWWRRQGAVEGAIPGATSPTYTVMATPLAASGDQFWVVVGNLVNSKTSDRATLTVLPEDNLKVEFTFSEGSGTVTANSGNLGGSGAVVATNGFPAFSTTVPGGPFAPSGNASSIDFGIIADGQGGRAVNLVDGIFGAQSGSMKAFTLAGWFNCRDLQAGPGGNRLICAHNFLTDPGFDLVQNADGTLQLGVNAWPDFPTQGPKSSPIVTADPDAGQGNWIFFAVTYDSEPATGHVTYYFGRPDAAAAVDLALDYPQGSFASTGAVTVGNLNTADGARDHTGGNSRCFRGLLDEMRVFNKALTSAEILAEQTGGGSARLLVPLDIVRNGAEIVLSWDSPEALELKTSGTLAPGEWLDEPTVPVVVGTRRSVTIPIAQLQRFYRLARP